MENILDGRTQPLFRALATAIVPEAERLEERDWEELQQIVLRALSMRPPGLRRQLRTFMHLLDLLPVLRWGRTFQRLDAERRARLLVAVERSPVFLVRRGFWGLRTLVFMGYYGRDAARVGVGYRASLRGWLDHPDGAGHPARHRLAPEARQGIDA